MLTEEAMWLGDHLCRMGYEHYPMINIGSSSGDFRERIQPHINRYIFDPLREQGKKVLHADMKDADGVDLVGDMNDGDFVGRIKNLRARSILCSSLLEHVGSPQTVCRHLEDMLDAGGLIVVTVPRLYPYHRDPIDTKFRPSVDELRRLFSRCTMLTGQTITSSDSHAKSLWKKLRQGNVTDVFVTVKRWLLPLYGMDEWRKAGGACSVYANPSR